ncbi:MAG TPA: TonB-dependent receptor [Candidatus Coprenecus stercoravium]|uniref:TonB-dependent receptor n=1 Tax=Candidatus Coprenecus stercoravium TaxID=2840735 RepID=A0A9D2KA01_9BACT|nr:TonB-dependent receptor [Candidatus Coprenecus stercoravium]
MKRLIKITAALLPSVFFSISVLAQDGINSTVKVERDYEGEIAGTVKSHIDAPVDDSLLNFKLNFDYTTFYSPYKDLYEFSPIQTVGPSVAGRTVYPWLYARVAAAYPWTPSADLYVSPRFGKRFTLGVRFNHDSYWGKTPMPVYSGNYQTSYRKIQGNRMTNSAGADMGYRWKKGEARLSAGYSAGMYAYNNESGSSRFEQADAVLNVRSTNADPSSFYYDFDLRYRYLSAFNSVSEHLADAGLSLGAAVKDEHSVYLRLDGTFSNFGLWKVSPMYKWAKGRWRVKAGLVLSSVYGNGVSVGGERTIVYPDAAVGYEAVANSLWLGLNVSGDNKLYARYDLLSINPWLSPEQGVYLTSTPVSVGLGLKGQVRDRFSYSLKVDYSMVNNMLSFGADRYMQKVYGGNSHTVGVDAAVRWKSRDFFAVVEAGYRYFSNQDAALMMPPFDLKAVLEYNLRQRLFIRADCTYRTSVTGMGTDESGRSMSYKVPSFVDVGVRISYAVNMRMQVFVEGNNLANSKIQYFLNYLEPGINIGAGLCFKL